MIHKSVPRALWFVNCLVLQTCPLKGLELDHEKRHRQQSSSLGKDLAPVVQKLDSAIQRINHYPVDKYEGNLLPYPVDRDLSAGKRYPPFEQLEPGIKFYSLVWQKTITNGFWVIKISNFGSTSSFSTLPSYLPLVGIHYCNSNIWITAPPKVCWPSVSRLSTDSSLTDDQQLSDRFKLTLGYKFMHQSIPAAPPGSAKFANAPPLGLTRWANTPL